MEGMAAKDGNGGFASRGLTPVVAFRLNRFLVALVIDSHVHLYPKEVSQDPAAWAVSRSERHWSRLVLPRSGRRSLQGWGDVGDLLREMDRAGVDRAVLQGWYWEHQETCDWQNRYYADCIRTHPDRLSAFAAIQPKAGRELTDMMRRIRDLGFLGLGELCPAAQNGELGDPNWMEVMHQASALGLIVLFHADEMVGRRHPGRVPTPPEDLQLVLEECPHLRVILAHLGGGLIFHCLNRGAGRFFDRVWFDTAASPLIYRTAVHAAAVACGAGDRILFGSDYPLITHPKETDQPDLLRSLDDVRAAGLAEADLDRVLGGNAVALFGIQGLVG